MKDVFKVNSSTLNDLRGLEETKHPCILGAFLGNGWNTVSRVLFQRRDSRELAEPH